MRIDLEAAIAATERLLADLQQLNGLEPDGEPTRAGRRQRTQINRDFLPLAHRADIVRVQIMDAYYDHKEWDWAGESEAKG